MIVTGLFLMPALFLALALSCLYTGHLEGAAVLSRLTVASWVVILALGCWGWLRKRGFQRHDSDTPY